VRRTGHHLCELNAQANRLAGYLSQLGVQPDDRVAICLPRGTELLIAVLAVLKSGSAYVPLDPGYPAERITYTLQDSQPVAVISDSQMGAELLTVLRAGLSDEVPLLRLDLDAIRWAQQDGADIARHDFSSTQLAYVIYTSGSTGLPKGVMVEHRQLVRLFSATEAHFKFHSGDVWTLFHSFAFDFSVWEIWGTLAYGGRLVVGPHAVSRSPQAFHELVCAKGVTVQPDTQRVQATGECPGAPAIADARAPNRHLRWRRT